MNGPHIWHFFSAARVCTSAAHKKPVRPGTRETERERGQTQTRNWKYGRWPLGQLLVIWRMKAAAAAADE